eukprot:1442699-Lingulodinium_polyedra.AAC.1
MSSQAISTSGHRAVCRCLTGQRRCPSRATHNKLVPQHFDTSSFHVIHAKARRLSGLLAGVEPPAPARGVTRGAPIL